MEDPIDAPVEEATANPGERRQVVVPDPENDLRDAIKTALGLGVTPEAAKVLTAALDA